MRNTFILIGILSFLAAILGVNYFFHPFAPNQPVVKPQLSPTPTKAPTIQLQAKTKVAQMVMAPLVLTPATKTALPSWLKQTKPRAVVIYGQDVDLATVDTVKEQLNSLNNGQDQKQSSSKVILATIADGGETQALTGDGFAPLPRWNKLCQQPLSQARVRLASAAAALNQAKIDLVLSPSVDLTYASTTAKLDTCSYSPTKTAKYAKAYTQAMAQFGIISAIKHFPGVGQLTKPLNQQFLVISVTKNDLLPFKQLVEADDVPPRLAVITSLAGVKQSGGGACALTVECVNQIKNTSNEVLVISDNLGQKAALFDQQTQDYTKSLSQVAKEAILAGNQLLWFGPNLSYDQLDRVINDLADEYETNATFANKVDRAVEFNNWFWSQS